MHPHLSPESGEGNLKLEKGEKFRGVCLISPLLSFDWGTSSYARNAHRDYLTVDSVFEMLDLFKPNEVPFTKALEIPDLCPADAPTDWWVDIPVERLLVTVGEWEVFFDSSVEFAEKVSRDSYEGTKVELVVGRREWHDAPIVNGMFWLKESKTSEAVVKWMGECRTGMWASFEEETGLVDLGGLGDHAWMWGV